MAADEGTDSDLSINRFKYGNNNHELVGPAAISREQRSGVSKLSDSDLDKMEVYKFDGLRSMRRRIRLLRLHGGGLRNPEITCELFEVEYDKDNQNILRNVYSDSDNGFKDSSRRGDSKSARNQNGRRQENAKVDLGSPDCSDPNSTVEYEALSWCWGTETKDCAIKIKKGGEYYCFAVTKELSLALKYLRHGGKDRILWIDALCIDQDNHEERNHQVQMMSRIYTGAKQACIWLGEDSKDSTTAIHFIREIMRLENFDSISENKENASRWQSLLSLMQRPWFSRRWVVQEIALARSATIYCGTDDIPWENFAVAVELFVEVETATHRLSEVMRKDETFGHVPQWFEHVSELGASVLVQATGKVFRRDGTKNPSPGKDSRPGTQSRRRVPKSKSARKNIDASVPSSPSMSVIWSPQRPLLSLEYLVSSLTVFEATQPRDAIYSLLAIARDTAPLAELQTVSTDGSEEAIIMSTVSSFLERKPFKVDYSRPYSDVCKDFVSSCIEKSARSDPTRALDILCRPWAPDAEEKTTGNVIHKKPVVYKFLPQDQRDSLHTKKSQYFITRKDHSNDPSDTRRVTDTEEQVEAPARKPKLYLDRRSTVEYWKAAEEVWKEEGYNGFMEKMEPYLPKKRKPSNSLNQIDDTSSESGESESEDDDPDQDIELPSWVSRISGASFALYRLPGMMQGVRIGRQNADALVGTPQEGHRNYSAAQNTKVDFHSDRRLRFRKRPGPRGDPASGHHSLYTEGFILTTIDTVAEPARLGAIPKTWTQIAEWDAVDGKTVPPAEFWRTLVADRGKDNRNPPYYYATACKESIRKGGLRGGSVDTGALISSERNSIIAEFCRRVQAVIWNRCLIKTKGSINVLGLASEHVEKGDLVCILRGCTVPVILRRRSKSKEDLEEERMQDGIESIKAALSTCEEACFRKNRYKKTLERERGKNEGMEEIWKREVREEMEAVNRELEELRKQEKLAEEERKKRDDQQKRRKKDAETRLKDAKVRREEAVNPARHPVISGHRSATMPVTGSMMSGGRLGTPLGTGGTVSSTDIPEDASSQEGRKQDVGDEDGDKLQKEKEEKEREDRKNQAREEDPKMWYKFMGEAYIHGMMDGEAVRLQINEGIPMRMFEIR
ncbi:hypothetical protein VPNG_02351 [Cytospora leucostoma]|uniref:Heterokaryon incompatibility domain-containing protein n=1 Tax=Cytospora leucostoma TaxID=1230097 RepID=A0A423XGF3_9PEZI|nr:hypothetical protein VPNG_02351 [Cytospora leucostoma]